MNVNLYSFMLYPFNPSSRFKTRRSNRTHQSLRILTLFCLSLFLASCEDGVFEPQSFSRCREVSQSNDAGLRIERIYSGKKVTKIEYYNYDVLQYYYEFTYDNNGRIIKSQRFNALNNTESTPEIISYNEKGKWIQSTYTNPSGDITTQTVEYDNQDQIKKITSSTNKSGNTTLDYTITYTWEDGNNIGYTKNSPTSQTVAKYEFNLDQKNKRRQEQEKLSFLSTAVAHNKNMLQSSELTTTTGSNTSKTTSEYSFEFDDNGYPSTLYRTTIGSAGSYTLVTTTFNFDCD